MSLWYTNGGSLGRAVGLNCDVRAWKDPGSILGASEWSMEVGIVVLALGGAYGSPRGIYLGQNNKFVIIK